MINLNKEEKQPIGTQNGLRIFKKLKAKTKLKARKKINFASKKQIIKNKNWRKITDERCIELNFTCEWCGQKGTRDFVFNRLEGHHKIPRRYGNNTKENCYVVHKSEHKIITDQNIDVDLYPNKKAWEKRNESKDTNRETDSSNIT